MALHLVRDKEDREDGHRFALVSDGFYQRGPTIEATFPTRAAADTADRFRIARSHGILDHSEGVQYILSLRVVEYARPIQGRS